MRKKLILLRYYFMSSKQLMMESERVGSYRSLIISKILLKRFPDDDEWDAFCEDFHARNGSEEIEVGELAGLAL